MNEHTKDMLELFYKDCAEYDGMIGRGAAHEFILAAMNNNKEKVVLETKVQMLQAQVDCLVKLNSRPASIIERANDLVALSKSGVLPPVPAECVGKISALDDMEAGE